MFTKWDVVHYLRAHPNLEPEEPMRLVTEEDRHTGIENEIPDDKALVIFGDKSVADDFLATKPQTSDCI